jgi:hypothetical protein
MGAVGSTGNLRWMALTVTAVATMVAATLVPLALLDDDPGPSLSYEDATPVPSTTTTIPRPTTTTIPAEPIGIDELPGDHTRVVATTDGIVLTTPDGARPPRRLTDESTWIAFGAGQGLVVSQGFGDEEHGSSPIVVHDARAEHELFGPGRPPETDTHSLHDVAFVGGRPYAVVATTSRWSAEDRGLHLLLVDLQTLERLDLGAVGGWEQWVVGARLLPNGDVVVLIGQHGGHLLEHRRLDGTTAWSVPIEGDESRTLTLHELGGAPTDREVLVIEPTHREDADHPRFVIRRYDIDTGAAAPPVGHALGLEGGLATPATFCTYAEAVEGTLLCDGGRGPTLRIDLADGSARAEPGSPPYGTMTSWRFEE